jgi:hypothetical protein
VRGLFRASTPWFGNRAPWMAGTEAGYDEWGKISSPFGGRKISPDSPAACGGGRGGGNNAS